MTTPDFDKLAAEKLPCDCLMTSSAEERHARIMQGMDEPIEHDRICPAFYRPAVAAALREMYEQGMADNERSAFDAGFKRGTQERNAP